MASVALAIENASSKAVSGELWWESHTQLFYALDKCGSVGGSGGGGRDGGALRRDRVEEEDDGFSHTQAEQLSRTDSRLVLLFPHFLPFFFFVFCFFFPTNLVPCTVPLPIFLLFSSANFQQ